MAMVTRRNGTVTAFVSCALVLSAASCSVDVFGLLVANDFDERFEYRDTFHLLTKEDRALLLPTEDEYSFVVLTDTHIEDGNDQSLGGLIAVIDTDGVGADDRFVVITGDITQNGKQKDLKCFIDFVKQLKEKKGIPCYPVLGNHDIYFNNWNNWRELIGSSCYRIGAPESGAALLIMDSANISFGSRQLDWLERKLAETSGRVFLFTHANFFVKDFGVADREQFTDVRERARVISLLAGRVDAVFSGHIHKRIERESGGVQYITLEDFKDNKTWCRVFISKDGIRREFNKL